MAFQTNVLRNGQWVTETVNLQAALKVSAAPQPASDPLPKPPVCGILYNTIAESPIVRWVLPVRLRSNTHNDIAFIGDRFIQINELGRDGQVHGILRKDGFPRIRNAIVLGECSEHGLDDDAETNAIKSEPPSSPLPQGSSVPNGPHARSFPPQQLVFITERGELYYLFVKEQPNAPPEFAIITCASPAPRAHLGYHLAVDPSSRYIAAASPDGTLAIYELESQSNISHQYALQNSIRPIRRVRMRVIQGVIHKLGFLFPRPEDDYHIILLLIVIRKERNHGTPISRMVTYEWEVDDDIEVSFGKEKIGIRLPEEHTMPMLLIPLRFKTSFFVVSRRFMGVVKDALSGSPGFDLLPDTPDTPRSTRLHHGVNEPLWTAWARPFRRKKYFEKTDIIYLAREDGAIIHVEIDAAELVPSVTNVGCLDTNIDTAFATAYDIFSDVLVVGGDSGPGGIWKLAPRQELEQVSLLPNWSPVVDMTTTNEYEYSTWNTTTAGQSRQRRRVQTNPRKLDSIFGASGRGLRGNVTQWRWGIQARIGLDIETGEPIRQAWTFMVDHHNGTRLYGLLALPHSSVVLAFSEDLGQIESISSDNTRFDLTSRTLHVTQVSETVVQVTETSIHVVTSTESSRCVLEDALAVPGVTAEHAFCFGSSIVALSTHTGQTSQLHVMQAEGINFSRKDSWRTRGEVTCISIFTLSTDIVVMAASVCLGVPWLSIYSLAGELIAAIAVTTEGGTNDSQDAKLEALTSICVFRQEADEVNLILGTRCGRLITLKVPKRSPQHMTWCTEMLGAAGVHVFPATDLSSPTPTTLACCDNNLILMTAFSHRDGKFSSKNFIWPTDSNDASMPSPPIHSVFSIPHSLSEIAGHMSLMILAGSRLLLVDVGSAAGHVSRSIPVKGTPNRVIFSEALNCLVVGLLDNDRPTLAFIDPDSGVIISVPTDKDKNHVSCISGLGTPGDRIYGLYEWLYVKDGKMFPFIVVTTKGGSLIIVSTEADGRNNRGGERQLKYWTRYKKSFGKPIYSLVADAEGLAFCVDRTLHWDVLDLSEKKLKPMKELELDSPATALRVVNGKIFALTTMHSLQVIDHRGRGQGQGQGMDAMALIHTDQVTRRTVHMIEAGDSTGNNLIIMSDQKGGISGVWIPWGQRNKEFEVVFEARLPCSVRRFARAYIKPPWRGGKTQPRYGTLPSTSDGADIIGVSIDGSMRQFTLIGLDLWRLLYLIQNTIESRTALASRLSRSRSASIFALDPAEADFVPPPQQKMMYIEGDYLRKVCELRGLELIVGTGRPLVLFCGYLDALDGGRYTAEFREPPHGDGGAEQRAKYFELGYKILEFLTEPARGCRVWATEWN